ncbi:Flap endonuclease GEN 1 [Teratosphaeria destructans]|uniref:Flap endonuclease GEN 1 n=1 Tax=Teratosphaeria destructans TaxID=418781 RepID=A0A9W7W251_9PEZI|nr:Flap endonuclease GEN 1 [Teratosphaeria destructans]
MGIHGLLRELGPAPRRSLAALSSDHYVHHSRPFRLAVDISIWLFQIQSGKGGSNPALRTFYYRLLRLLTLNIHPLFVFDGPNKPLFKRNKKVGGPGVRVASVPEFLAKQLLKQFGFPWHVAPGEAEAECALLQREGVVDAVLSEDVDTLMFGSGVTLRNWSAENTSKTPTHVSIYRDGETKERSRGIDREGMILVALMSGGDYLPEGIPGCGPKVACDAARAGFGQDLCALDRKDKDGLSGWKERLTHQIRTNEARYFSRKNTGFKMPEDFPNLEVLGYYTHPCVSSPEKVQRLKETLRWDQDIDFPALRSFAGDAFDWRCVTGAKKFIKNLAPAMLVRELRLRAVREPDRSQPEAQEAAEKEYVKAIHGKRHHATVDQELELRVSFTPADLVPIDLSMEDEDDDFLPAGGVGEAEDTETDDGLAGLPSSTADEDAASDAPSSPTKKRQFRPFDPSQPEKVWILKTFLQMGCPLLVEEYEASFKDPKEFLKARRKAKAVKAGEKNVHAKPAARKRKDKTGGMAANALMAYAQVSKTTAASKSETGTAKDTSQNTLTREPLTENSSQGNTQSKPTETGLEDDDDDFSLLSAFQKPSTRLPSTLLDEILGPANPPPSALPSSSAPAVIETIDMMDTTPRPFPRFARKNLHAAAPQRTPSKADTTPPNRKRRSNDLSPSPAPTQRTITSYYSPSPAKQRAEPPTIIDLISSPPKNRPLPPNLRTRFIRSRDPAPDPTPLPGTVTTRRRRKTKRVRTAPVSGVDGDLDDGAAGSRGSPSPRRGGGWEEEEEEEEEDLPPLHLLRRETAVRRPSLPARDATVDPPCASREGDPISAAVVAAERTKKKKEKALLLSSVTASRARGERLRWRRRRRVVVLGRGGGRGGGVRWRWWI